MTIEELLDCDVAALEQMTDDDLAKHFAPYLVVCNPPEHEPNVVNIGKPKRKKAAKKKEKLADQMRELADLHGVDLEKINLPANLQ